MMDTVVCLAVILIFCVKTADFLPTIETLTECGQIENGNSVTLRCRTSDLQQVIRFQLNDVDKALCFANGGTCRSTNTSIYTKPDQHSGIYTDMTILYYNDIENDGNWTCVYDTTKSEKLKLSVVECPETTTEEHPSTTEQSTFGSSIISTASSYSTTIGSGKNPKETVSIISTDNQFTSTNASVVSENKSVLVPVVISISVLSFCLVVIFIVVLCVVYHKRHANGKKMSDKYSDVTLSRNDRHDYQTHGTNIQDRKDVNDKNTTLKSLSKYMYNSEVSSNNYYHSIRDVQQQGGRHLNKNSRVYNGADERGQAFVYHSNTHNEFSRPRQMNIPNEYKVYNGNNRRGVKNSKDPHYSYPNCGFY